MQTDAARYIGDELAVSAVRLSAICAAVGTPAYVYSARALLDNLARVRAAFAESRPQIHYSAKANANLSVLRVLIDAGAGIDAVSAGEIHRALLAGVAPSRVVFAGVGKTPDEIDYAVAHGVGWFNVENVEELRIINSMAEARGVRSRVALRLNPDVTADTDPHIATGHSGAKFGLLADTIREILATTHSYPSLDFAGIHVHIGSQLRDVSATVRAIQHALDLIRPYPFIRTVNIGGGLAVRYTPDDPAPDWDGFGAALAPHLRGYDVLLEPGRAIAASAGVLLVRVLYVKHQGGRTFVITDGSMAELMRPALYHARHQILPVRRSDSAPVIVQVVGPVCETTDTLGHDVALPPVSAGDLLAICTTGAYGMVMASNYNARPRPPEVMVNADGTTWHIARQRETFDDLTRAER